MGSILEEMKEITQYLKSSPDRIDNMSASVHAGSTRCELDFQQFGSVSREAKIKKFGFFYLFYIWTKDQV